MTTPLDGTPIITHAPSAPGELPTEPKRGELACVLNCLREILRPHEYSAARVVDNYGREQYKVGDWVLVSRVTKNECVIEHAMTPSEIDKQKANGSLLRTWITTIGFPVTGVVIELVGNWAPLADTGEVERLRERIAQLEHGDDVWEKYTTELEAVLLERAAEAKKLQSALAAAERERDEWKRQYDRVLSQAQKDFDRAAMAEITKILSPAKEGE